MELAAVCLLSVQPVKRDRARVEAVIACILETLPKNATHWGARTMAKAGGLYQNVTARIWWALGLKPHLRENFKLSTDPLIV